MENLLEIAIVAAIEAGKEILEIYGKPDFGIEIKKDSTPLTLADKAAHETIFEYLTSLGIPILSEEGKAVPWEIRNKWNRFWLVDPLDGTKEFIKKNGEFTVNIALIEKGKPILGVVFVPVSGDLFFADHRGSFKTTIKIKQIIKPSQIIKSAVKLPFTTSREFYVVVGSRSHQNPETEEFINQIDTMGKPLKMITKGSSLKLCMVATGEADLYPRLGSTMEWDIAAGYAIAFYAGKSITQIPSGKPVVFNKKNLLNPFFIVK